MDELSPSQSKQIAAGLLLDAAGVAHRAEEMARGERPADPREVAREVGRIARLVVSALHVVSATRSG